MKARRPVRRPVAPRPNKVLYRFSETRADVAPFSWVVGPVHAVRFAYLAGEPTGLAILYQGDAAYAVVTDTDYLACCPNIDAASAFIQRRVDAALAVPA